MKHPHTSTYKGKRVFIRLKSGVAFIGKFLDKKASYVFLDNRTVPIKDIKSFSIFKNQ